MAITALIGRAYAPAITEAIKNAKHDIKILMYDWRWYPKDVSSPIQIFNHEVLRAAIRGVQVLAVVNHDAVGTFVDMSGVTYKKYPTSKTLHVKMIIIDDFLVFLGSHNLTKSAFSFNHELSLSTDDVSVVSQCLSFFNSFC